MAYVGDKEWLTEPTPCVGHIPYILAVEGARVGGCAQGRDVLVIQDTTEINFDDHTGSKRGFGRGFGTVGNGEDIGPFLHPQFVLDATQGGVRGL
jgi:hypothetical protein